MPDRTYDLTNPDHLITWGFALAASGDVAELGGIALVLARYARIGRMFDFLNLPENAGTLERDDILLRLSAAADGTPAPPATPREGP